MRNFTKLIERIGKGLEWTLKGGWFDDGGRPGFKGFAVTHCDGPVPAINEQIPVTESAHVEKLMRVLRGMAKVCDAAAAWVESDEIPCPNCSMYEPGDNVPCECDVIVGIQMRDQDTTKRALAALAREMEEACK